jgi:co-chaperonin GroES (HSP10)
MKGIEPIRDRVFIKPNPKKTESQGFDLDDEQHQQAQIGTIVAVGPGQPGEEMQTSVGDTVLYGKYSGVIYKEGEEDEIFIMREPELLSIIKKAQ